MLAAEAGRCRHEIAPHPVGNGESFVKVAHRHAGREFLAADAGEQHIGTERRRRGAGKGLQHGIADRMAETVIDLLEAIEIEQQHGERLVVDSLSRHEACSAVEESPAIGDAAQRVDQRIDLMFELGALLRHIELQESHDNREQQRAECKQRE